MKNRNTMNIVTTILFWLACLALSPKAQAVNPPPDGAYPGGNTAEGQAALLSLTTGGFNTAVGFLSLRSASTSSFNTAIGAGTLLASIGEENTATGAGALLSNTTGGDNTANGTLALLNNTEGAQNTANGDSALFANTTGSFNTATGFNALAHNIDGSNNTANGHAALFNNTSGSNNVAMGRLAGSNLDTGDNNIDIGYNVLGVAGESNTIRIGDNDITDTFIRGISGATASGGAAVFVNSNGKLGTMTSSARFKKEIKPMDQASEVLFSLNPVTFHYKKEIDPAGIPQFGLVAEEVEKVSPDLVIHDAAGKPQTVRYEQINTMLLNEFLKEHKKVEQQCKEVEALRAELKEQRALILQVNDKIEFRKSARQIVSNQP